MKHRVAELEGEQLDIAVALAEGVITPEHLQPYYGMGGERVPAPALQHLPRFSREWTHGGPIIERERIGIAMLRDEPRWIAEVGADAFNEWRVEEFPSGSGPTALIAAMRAYVASKLGEEVELP